MKIHTLFATSALAAFALATPIEYADALDRRQAGTTVIPACATATGTATPVAPSTIASATAGCVGVVTFGQNTIRNDIVDGVCKPFTLIFARGTSENMNMGNLVGPPFVLALEQAFGGSQNVAVQGVNNYPADVAGFCAGGSSTGSANMAQLIEQTVTQCPNTKLCISGYSQGAQVVHNAADMISQKATNFVNSVVLFGDPDFGEKVGRIPKKKVMVDCHAGDNICEHGSRILLQHLNYCQDVNAEAAFAKQRSTQPN